MTKARDIASAAPAPSTVSATELGYLDGVTSAIQTQLDAKTAKSTLTTTGDIYYASSANTPARLGIGSTGNVLTVASGIPSWAAPAGGGGFTVLASGNLPTGGTNLDLQSISGSYNDLRLVLRGVTANGVLGLDYRVNNNSNGIYNRLVLTGEGTTVNTQSSSNSTTGLMTYNSFTNGGTPATWILDFPDYANTTSYKFVNVSGFYEKHDNTNIYESLRNFSGVQTTSAIDRIAYIQSGSQITGGTYVLYGIK